MINKKGQTRFFVRVFAFSTEFLLLFLALMATIEPFKEVLDEARGNIHLNCPGTPGFNQTFYDNQTSFDKINKRPTCFVTGMIMVIFIGSFLIASVFWVFKNSTK